MKGSVMERLALLIALGACSCEREAREKTAMPAPAAPDTALSTQAPASQIAKVVPLPKDQAQLDRMILAGYTPHADHLHPPGVNECPLTRDTDVVM